MMGSIKGGIPGLVGGMDSMTGMTKLLSKSKRPEEAWLQV